MKYPFSSVQCDFPQYGLYPEKGALLSSRQKLQQLSRQKRQKCTQHTAPSHNSTIARDAAGGCSLQSLMSAISEFCARH